MVSLTATWNPVAAQTSEEYFNRGKEKFKQLDTAGARQDFTEAIRLNPKFADAYYERGFLSFIGKNYKSAIQDCCLFR